MIEQLTWDHVLLVAGWLIAGMWLATVLPSFRHSLGQRPLGAGPLELREDDAWPEVTVVAPARNEASAVRAALRSLLDLDYPSLRIVAVDDRSTDATGAIMDELATSHPRLAVIHVSQLPPGWLGKNHANWIGAAQSQSPWILFTDADVLFRPDALKHAIHIAQQRQLDHLALYPGRICGGFWEDLMVLTFALVLTLRYKPWRACTPDRRYFMGIGAFNLVSRKAYETIGTHRRLAMEVADDVKLGKLIKQHGLRQDVLMGSLLIQVRWQLGLRGVVRGLTKNAFAAFDYSLARTLGASAGFLLMFLLPYLLAVLAPGYARLGFLAALCVLHATFFTMVRASHANLLLPCLLPVSLSVFLFAVWRSALITLRQGGVQWRDTFYPLDELRKGLV